MPTRHSLVLGSLITLLAATVVGATSRRTPVSVSVVRVSSATPGQEVTVRGVLLVLGHPMQVTQQTTPFEVRTDSKLVFAAFEPDRAEGMLRLELISDIPEPAVVTAPRVMVGHRIGGVATEFVQGY